MYVYILLNESAYIYICMHIHIYIHICRIWSPHFPICAHHILRAFHLGFQPPAFAARASSSFCSVALFGFGIRASRCFRRVQVGPPKTTWTQRSYVLVDRARDKGDSRAMVCGIRMFMWSFGPLPQPLRSLGDGGVGVHECGRGRRRVTLLPP